MSVSGPVQKEIDFTTRKKRISVQAFWQTAARVAIGAGEFSKIGDPQTTVYQTPFGLFQRLYSLGGALGAVGGWVTTTTVVRLGPYDLVMDSRLMTSRDSAAYQKVSVGLSPVVDSSGSVGANFLVAEYSPAGTWTLKAGTTGQATQSVDVTSGASVQGSQLGARAFDFHRVRLVYEQAANRVSCSVNGGAVSSVVLPWNFVATDVAPHIFVLDSGVVARLLGGSYDVLYGHGVAS